jgi:uncharacterized protein
MTTIHPPLPIGTGDAGPLQRNDRIEAIDVLRGLALLGIILVNASIFGLPLAALVSGVVEDESAADRIVATVITIIAEHKFISIFSLLFGFGIAMQRSRRLAATGRFAGFGLRRMAMLAVFGLVHALGIWFGDVLFLYAGVGAVLIALLPLPTTARGWIGIGAIGFMAVLATGLGLLGLLVPRAPTDGVDVSLRGIEAILAAGGDPNHPAWIAAEIAAGQQGPAFDAFLFRAISWGFGLISAVLGFGWHVLGMALIGTWMFDTGFFKPRSQARRRRWAAICLPMGIVLAIGVGVGWWIVGRDHLPMGPMLGAVHAFEAAVLAIGIVSLVPELVAAGRFPAARLFAAVGRLSLTAYLLESVLFTAVMQFWGLGWFGTLGRVELLGLAVAVYLTVAAMCILWSRRFGMGPLERVWRWASYGPGSGRGERVAAPRTPPLGH